MAHVIELTDEERAELISMCDDRRAALHTAVLREEHRAWGNSKPALAVVQSLKQKVVRS